MKRFVRLRAAEGHIVPDPRQHTAELDINYSGPMRMLARRELKREELRAIADELGLRTLREVPRELRYVATDKAGKPIEVVLELDRTVRKLIRQGAVQAVGFCEAATVALAKPKLDKGPDERAKAQLKELKKARRKSRILTAEEAKQEAEERAKAAEEAGGDEPSGDDDSPTTSDAFAALEELTRPDPAHGEDTGEEEAG